MEKVKEDDDDIGKRKGKENGEENEEKYKLAKVEHKEREEEQQQISSSQNFVKPIDKLSYNGRIGNTIYPNEVNKK